MARREAARPTIPVVMLKVLVLAAQNNVADARMEWLIRDRLNWLSFLGFDLGAATPDANTIRTGSERSASGSPRLERRRHGIADRVRHDLTTRGIMPTEPKTAEKLVEDEVAKRIRHSGRTNVSRAVSELVRAGLICRHYQAYCVDHGNRGAQRKAVYTVTEEARLALDGRRWQATESRFAENRSVSKWPVPGLHGRHRR